MLSAACSRVERLAAGRGTGQATPSLYAARLHASWRVAPDIGEGASLWPSNSGGAYGGGTWTSCMSTSSSDMDSEVVRDTLSSSLKDRGSSASKEQSSMSVTALLLG